MSLSIYFYLTLYCIIIGQYLSFGQSDLTLPVNAISAFKMNEAGNALFQISNTSEQHPNNGNSINVDDENINDNMSKQNKKSSFSIPDKLRLLWFDHRIPYYLMKPILGGQSGNPSAYVYQNGLFVYFSLLFIRFSSYFQIRKILLSFSSLHPNCVLHKQNLLIINY